MVPTFIGALRHPPPTQRGPFKRRMPHNDLPVVRCHRIFHLRLDEELQDVGVVRVLEAIAQLRGTADDVDVVVAVVVVVVAADLGAQNQIPVVQAALHGILHDVEPGPRLHHALHAVLALVGLLQVLRGAKQHKVQNHGQEEPLRQTTLVVLDRFAEIV